MPTTLQELIEEVDAKEAVTRVVIGGAQLPKVTSISYSFVIGQSPTAQLTIPGLIWLPNAIQEEAAVQIWFGYRSGFVYQERLVFGGAVVDSIGNNGADITVTCVMDGPRKLNYSYNRRITYNFDNVTAEESVIALLALAGVANYAVNLDAWLIGTAVPQTIQFSTYGEAINKVAEVDGTPWYAMPTGQVRVEARDPIPNPTARRTYFTGVLTGPFESQPTGISNTAARPRINDITRDTKRDEVGNFIEVDGAVVTTIGPNGEQNSEQIIETVDGASGQFPNGAFWIPTPPLFQDFTFSNELIDTNAKAFEVAERYFGLKNRLFEELNITVPGDPDVFLGATVKIIDPSYSGVNSLYFVKGYSTNIDAGSCTTILNLTGGPESGTTGFASPFAEFYWMYQALHSIIPGNTFGMDLGPGAQAGGKLCEDVPADANQDPEHSNDPGVDQRMVIIGLDGSASQDFDGYIVSWAWSWVDQNSVTHNFTGMRSYLLINPELQTSVSVTLTVTDNSGRTDSITKNIYTDADRLETPENPFTPQEEDTDIGGGVTSGPCTDFFPPYGPYDNEEQPQPLGGCAGMGLAYYVAATEFAMGSADNRTWHDLAKGDVPVSGDFISVGSGFNNATGKSYALFGTDNGEVVLTDDTCQTGELVFTAPGNPSINCIWFDSQDAGIPAEGDAFGDEGGPDASITIPVYTQASPGTLTILQAYQQCLKVGFSPASAVIAVAIMIRESGLYSAATNSIGNTPPSTDRGIAQWNSYYWPQISDACAFNTECAIQKMFQYSNGGTDFTPWNNQGSPLNGVNLTVVQEAVGYVGNITAEQGSTSNQVPLTFRVWLGTQDGRVYASEDSGRTWALWVDFADSHPVKWIATPAGGSLWVYGGDTSEPNTLVRIDPHKTKEFVPLAIFGDLLTAIHASGGANTILTAAANNTALLLGFSGGVSPPVWTNSDPIGSPDGWVPATGLPTGVVASAPGFDGEFLVA